jgi:ABC-type multidrug transport system ATPase subunit
MKTFNSGSINVLGSQNVSDVSHRIGFMPQHVELVPKLTVAENLSFFGNIHHLTRQKLESQVKMLTDLLEIHFQDSQVMELSGGQQRRVALAVALIHDPQLLILDEPTVGLDVLLRAKIWDFLQSATENRQMSVLVTTHYIFEAQFAHRCGFMRKGAILAENSPAKIMESLEVENLDDAFVELCKFDDENVAGRSPASQNGGSHLFEETGSGKFEEFQLTETETVKKRPSFTFQTFSALFMKEIHRFKRTPS